MAHNRERESYPFNYDLGTMLLPPREKNPPFIALLLLLRREGRKLVVTRRRSLPPPPPPPPPPPMAQGRTKTKMTCTERETRISSSSSSSRIATMMRRCWREKSRTCPISPHKNPGSETPAYFCRAIFNIRLSSPFLLLHSFFPLGAADRPPDFLSPPTSFVILSSLATDGDGGNGGGGGGGGRGRVGGENLSRSA